MKGDAAYIAKELSAAKGYSLLRLSTTWATVREAGCTGMGATLLCLNKPPLAERFWARWGADSRAGIKGGEAYEYRLTPLGEEVRAILVSLLGGERGGEGEGA